MKIDKLIKGADIVRLIKTQRGIFKEWAKQDQLGSQWIGNLCELDQ
jgi:hypothetical protein